MVRNLSPDPPRWYFLPPEMPRRPAFRRSGIFIIVVLAFLTLGVLVAGFLHPPSPAIANHNSSQSTHHASSHRAL